MQTPATQQTQSFWSRSWRWLVPLGCFGLLFTCLGFSAFVYGAASAVMRGSDVYEDSLRIARSDPAVVKALGEPIEEGFWITGSIAQENDSGSAELDIPLEGPSGSGTLVVRADKRGGAWSYNQLQVRVDETDVTIPLTPEP